MSKKSSPNSETPTSCPMLLHGKLNNLIKFKEFIKDYGWSVGFTEGTGPQKLARYTTGPDVAPTSLPRLKVKKDGSVETRLIIFSTIDELDKFMQAAADAKWKLAFHGFEDSFVGFPVFTPYLKD